MVDNSSVTRQQVLTWTRRVEAQRSKTAMLDSLKETKDFDAIWSQKNGSKQERLCQKKSKYRLPPKKDPATEVLATYLDRVQSLENIWGIWEHELLMSSVFDQS